jgi:hypothetical protein
MEKIFYNKNGDPVAYLAMDYEETIYLWDGLPVAYIYEGEHVYGINGRHLGWFKDDILYNHGGERVGFTFTTCPVSVAKPPAKGKKSRKDEMRPRWQKPPLPKLSFSASDQDLADLLKEGQVTLRQDRTPTEGSSS